MPESSNASHPTRRTCATSILNHRQLENPDYRARRARIEEFARSAVPPTGIVDVTVVVHIVSEDPTFVTDAQVHGQIDVLNEDFQGRNTDISSVPAVFQGVVGNPEIRFTLASVDPDGNSTTGITRTTTTVERFSSADDGVKFAARGGRDAWDTTRYLNIWVARVFDPDPDIGDLLG